MPRPNCVLAFLPFFRLVNEMRHPFDCEKRAHVPYFNAEDTVGLQARSVAFNRIA